jgi:hypothetical protein
MAAIIPKYNPLMAYGGDQDNNFIEYYNKYYENSDIDILCTHDKLIDFIKCVYYIRDVICENISENNKYEVTLSVTKSLSICINEKALKSYCASNPDEDYSYEYLINNKESYDVKSYFHAIYYNKKRAALKNNNEFRNLSKSVDEEKIIHCLKPLIILA